MKEQGHSEKTKDAATQPVSASPPEADEIFRPRARRNRLHFLNLKKARKDKLYDYVWLVYSVFFFIGPFQHRNLRYWLLFVAFYAAFFAAYSGLIFSRTKRQSHLMLALIWIMGLAYFPWNEAIGGIFIYITAFVPFVIESLAAVLVIFVAVCASVLVEGYILHITPWAWGFIVVLSLIIGFSNLLMSQRVRANTKLELAHEELEHLAKIAERERIARDLHDVLGHTLSVVVLKSELAGRLIDHDPVRARAEITDVEQTARKALNEVREAIRGYRAEGLAAEIERAHRTLDAAGVTLVCESKPPSLSPAEETVLALAVREAVTNIVRHAHASHCRMRFVTKNGFTSLTVEDDGQGNVRQEGNGLRGMRERIEALGGHLNIEGKQGTRLCIEIPLRTA